VEQLQRQLIILLGRFLTELKTIVVKFWKLVKGQ
jgi:hypothetical protein